MPPNEPRRHHFFPRFHLEHFSPGERRVWVYDKRGQVAPNPRLLSVETIALEVDLYADDADESPMRGVEQWLAQEIDGPAAQVFGKIRDAAPIMRADRVALARYLLSRDLRTPRARDFLLDIAQQELDAWYREWKADPVAIQASIAARSGVTFDLAELGEMLEDFTGELHITKGFWLAFLIKHVAQGAARLLSYGWAPIYAEPGREFLASDAGIVKYWTHFGDPAPPALGWMNDAHGWIAPLAPTVALGIAPGLTTVDKLASSPFLDSFNATVVQQAERFVFARDVATLRRAIDGVLAG